MTIYCYCSIFLIMTMIFSITMTGLLRLATMTMTCDDLGRHCREVSHWAASDPSPDNLRGEPGKSTIGGSFQQNIHHPLKKGGTKRGTPTDIWGWKNWRMNDVRIIYIYIRMYIHPLRPLTFRDSHDAMESARGPRLIQVPMKAEDWCRGTLQSHETWLAGEMGTALERYHWKIWKINYSSIAYIEMKLSRWEKSSNCGLSIAILDCGSGCFFRFVDVTSWFKSLVSSLLRLMAETQRLR